jgi:hypothetical protein
MDRGEADPRLLGEGAQADAFSFSELSQEQSHAENVSVFAYSVKGVFSKK